MSDTDTFLVSLYVIADDFIKHLPPALPHPGPDPDLTPAEVITLTCVSQWDRYRNESDFYACALRDLRSYFPKLPDYSQFNRQVCCMQSVLEQFALHLADLLHADQSLYQALDGTAVPVRNYRRRNRERGHLASKVNIGRGHRTSWFEGFHLQIAVSGEGVITGYNYAPASHKEQVLAEGLLAARSGKGQALATAGRAGNGRYLTDKGYEGKKAHQRWQSDYGAEVVTPPRRTSKQKWSKEQRLEHSSKRQIVETVFGKLHRVFRLEEERPHSEAGFAARLAAKVGLHNFCLWLNQQLGQARLGFMALLCWLTSS